MKDSSRTDGNGNAQQSSTCPHSKRTPSGANAFESWLFSYRGRLADVCDGDDQTSRDGPAQDEKGKDVKLDAASTIPESQARSQQHE